MASASRPMVELRDLAIAAGISAASAIFHGVPIIGDRIVGSDSPFYESVRWHMVEGPDTQEIDWVRFDGNPYAGRTPRNWPEVGVIGSHWHDLNKLSEDGHRQPTAAYRLGSVTMAAALPEDWIMASQKSGNRAIVGLRIGKKALEVILGVQRKGVFTPALTWHIARRAEGELANYPHPLQI